MYVVDASVWISAAAPGERDHPLSRAFVDRLGAVRPRLVLPHLAYVEVAATIGRMHGDAALGIELAEAISALPFVVWADLDGPLARASASVATTHRLRGADAVYAAVALEYGCDLVSLDREHLTRLGGVVRAVTPAAALASLPPVPS